MAKKISELTVSDFPYIYKLSDSVRLVSNVSGLGARYFHSNRTGGHIYLDSGIPTNYNEYFTGHSFDFYADNNDSPLKFPTEFMDYTGKIPKNDIDTNVLNVGSAWFSSYGQKMVWLYFVVDDTPTDLEHINPSLKADNVTVSITGNTVTLTANSGYKIKDATLDIGNSLFGDGTPLKFTVSPDKTTATVTVTDQSLINPSQQYTLTVHTTVITDLEHINPSLKADNVSIKITGNTVTLTAKDGYKIKDATLDIGNSLFGDDTPLDFTVSPDKTTATVTVTDDSLIDPNQEYNLTVHTEEVPTETPTQPSPPTPPAETPDTNKFTGTVTSKIQGITANLNKMTGVINITIPDNSNFTGTVNIVDSANQTIETLAINNNTVTIPDRYANDNFVVDGVLKYQTNYKVDVFQIKDYIDYKTDGLIITLTAKQDVTINSLRAVADLSLFGETHQLDSSVIKIADNKKSATITVPNDYNSKLGYTIVISGDFTKNTPIPTNPKATGTLHVYQLDDKTLEDFSTKAIETFNSGHNEVYNFQKFITQLYKLPFFIPETESTGTTNILTGWYTINEPARLLNKNHYVKDLGNIKVLPVNNNGYDHNVTSCTLYLPFVSPINVSYETVLNHTVNIKYDTDLAGAKTTVNIFVDNELYKTIQVSIIENLDLYNIYNDSINGSLSSILNNTLNHCFIKVEYNKPIENLVSYETLEHNTLSNYTNFVKTKNANVSCGTQQEQTEIENLLNGGIYIKWVWMELTFQATTDI